MSETTKATNSRREFLKNTGRIAAASALVGGITPRVHAAENNTIQLALVGCGGRGTGAAANALSTKSGPVKLVAMADVFKRKLDGSHGNLKRRSAAQFDVPEERKFLGFDGYKKAMDCLKPGDVVLLTTPPAFRWVHFTYAIEKGLNVFMEKPASVDGPTTRRMIKLAAEADKKNLKVGVGLMVRHCRGRRELKKRIDDGQIGEILMMRGCRLGGRWTAGPKPSGISHLLYQIQRFHGFIWASGGLFNDFNIHQIDELSWMKGAWPVSAHALGGRHYRGNAVDQNLDTYSIEYIYPDGARMFFTGRYMSGCYNEFASYAHGTKGSAIVSTSAHHPGRVRMYKGHHFAKEDLLWGPPAEPNPYQLEWDDLMEAIRQDKPYNEAKRGAEASMVSSMGRMAAHTGQIITFDQMLNSEYELAPDVDKLTMNSPAPLQAGPDGKYPVPMPGIKRRREY